ncbi:MAG: FAD-binding oxidoreductase, partial [bacterium]|nr:FAD-binding oxidoreductase [bacterium]
GNIATNAGGIKVGRYGLTRDWVAGLKVVTGKGDIMELNHGLVKNATGYDLRYLFIGSEGTLGFIVEATLRLTRQTGPRKVILFALPHLDAVMDVMLAFRDRINLNAYEFFSDLAMDHVIERNKVERPFDTKAPFYALIEFDAPGEDVMDTALQLFEHCNQKGWVLDGVVSESETQLKKLWRFREDISETISVFVPYKNDISVTISNIPSFLRELESIVVKQYPDFEVLWYGHIADGNLHLNILKPRHLTVETFETQCKQVNRLVFDVVKKYNGSVSAEHGVGLLKKPYLDYTRGPEEIQYMRALKQVFDPNGIMNPGKLFDTPRK